MKALSMTLRFVLFWILILTSRIVTMEYKKNSI
jgi:hypothetical protein